MRVVGVLVALAGVALADPVTDAADKALEVFRAKGDLKELAAADDPDPWLVADELCARGEFDAAEAFARAAPRKDVEKLPEYVAAQRAKPTDPAARQALAAANEALSQTDAERPDRALAMAAPGDDVTGARLRHAQGLALLRHHNQAGSTHALREAAVAAERIGWIRRAATVLGAAGKNALDHEEWKAAIEPLARRLTVEEARGDVREVAATLVNLAIAYRGSGDHGRAMELLERALELFEKLGDDSGATRARVNIALIHQDRGENRRALELYEQVLARCEELGERRGEMVTLRNIALIQLGLGEHRRALGLQQRALELAEALGDRTNAAALTAEIGDTYFHLEDLATALGLQESALSAFEALGHSAGVARVLVNSGRTLNAQGDAAGALARSERALPILSRLGDHSGMATALGNAGAARIQLGDYSGGLASALEAAALAESAGDRDALGRALLYAGTAYERLGRYPEALAALHRALGVNEQRDVPRDIAATLGKIALVHLRMGALPRALDLSARALRISETARDRSAFASSLLSHGALCAAAGDYARGMEMLDRARRAFEELNYKPSVATALADIGVIHLRRGNATEALSALEQARAIEEAIGNRGGLAVALGNIGIARQMLGDYSGALAVHERALQLKEELGDSPGAAATLACIGGVHYSRGDAPQSLAAYRRAHEVFQRLSLKEGTCRALLGMALAHLAAGSTVEARSAARDGARVMRELASGLADEQGAVVLGEMGDLLDAGLAAARAMGDPIEVAHFMESGRAMMLLEGLQLRRLNAAVFPHDLREAEQEARGHERIALARYRRQLQTDDAGALWKDVESAREEVIAAVQRIQREAKAQAALLYPEADPLDTIRAALRPGEALVSYALLEKSALALLVTPGGARIVDLDAKLVEAVEAFQRAVARPDERGVTAPPHERLPFLRDRLAKLLVEPLKLDGKTTRLRISPDGLLAYVPFSVLTDREVVYVPSGTTYRLLLEERGHGGEKVLAIGDPDYSGGDRTAVSIYAGDEGLEALPGTRKEAQAVGDVVLLGKQATRAAFAEALGTQPRWRAVHFACHGSVDPERPVLSSLALTAEGDDDGFLKCLDVYQMRIPADLVVLSACETGKGRIYRAEGVIGFTRAFMFAGAPRVIVSLWKVDDHATRALMEKFYEAWKPGKLGAAAALRAAQEHVRSQEKWKHPYFWAAWQLWGLGD